MANAVEPKKPSDRLQNLLPDGKKIGDIKVTRNLELNKKKAPNDFGIRRPIIQRPARLDGVGRKPAEKPKTAFEEEKKQLRESQGLAKPELYIPGGKARRPQGTQDNVKTGQKAEDQDYKEEPGEENTEIERGSDNQAINQPSINEQKSSGDNSEEKAPNIQNSLANRAVDYLRGQLKKLFSKEARSAITGFIIANWYWVLAAFVIIILGFLLFSYFFSNAGRSPSETGQSATQVYDPIKDRNSLTTVLQLSGDKGVQELSSWTLISGLEGDLKSLKTDLLGSTRWDKTQLIEKIDQILPEIGAFNQSKNKNTGLKIIQDVKDLVEALNTLPTIAGAGSPLPSGLVPARYTKTLHDGTAMNKCKGGCPKGHRTYQQTSKGTCDAVDVSLPAKTQIFSAFDGKVVRNGKDGIGHNVVFIQSTDGYLATYAHIDSSVKVNQPVKAKDQIGTVASLSGRYSGPHLHFELSKDGKCVVTTSQDMADSKTSNKDIGYYLWQRMLKVLNAAS